MAGVTLNLNAGSFTGSVFPVDLDIAYNPDRVDVVSSVSGSAYIYFDEDVAQFVTGSASSGGEYMEGSGVISWSSVTASSDGSWTKVGASLQWTNYRETDTVINGSFLSRETGNSAAPPRTVVRPSVPLGTKLKKSD